MWQNCWFKWRLVRGRVRKCFARRAERETITRRTWLNYFHTLSLFERQSPESQQFDPQLWILRCKIASIFFIFLYIISWYFLSSKNISNSSNLHYRHIISSWWDGRQEKERKILCKAFQIRGKTFHQMYLLSASGHPPWIKRHAMILWVLRGKWSWSWETGVDFLPWKTFPTNVNGRQKKFTSRSAIARFAINWLVADLMPVLLKTTITTATLPTTPNTKTIP